MPTQVWRAGDYRVCPSCGTRHKVQDLRCERCHTILAGTPVQHSAPARIAAPAARPGRGMRAFLAVAVVVALGAGLWVRSLFRGAPLQDSVEASSVTVPPAPAPEPHRFKVVDVLTGEVRAEGAGTRATVELLTEIRSSGDVRIYVWEPDGERWRLLTLAEQRTLWGLRDRLAAAP